MLGSTEDLGVHKEEEIPDRSDGEEEERDLDISDRRRHPRLAIRKKAKLLNCDKPCAEEEWRATPSDIKWRTLATLEFAYRGEKKVKLERDTEKVAPASAKPPPPEAPPSTYSRDKDAEKGVGKGKGKGKTPKESREKEKGHRKEGGHWRK